MTWRYAVTHGELTHNDEFVGTGYSGKSPYRNDPTNETRKGLGPIPRGQYAIGEAEPHPRLGPIAMPLTPIGHDACGRSAFFIHGDNARHDASHGCIILGPSIRKEISESEDKVLVVTT